MLACIEFRFFWQAHLHEAVPTLSGGDLCDSPINGTSVLAERTIEECVEGASAIALPVSGRIPVGGEDVKTFLGLIDAPLRVSSYCVS